MTTALNDVDAHAQTDGHPPSGEPVQVGELSSKRSAQKLAIRLMSFYCQQQQIHTKWI
jgi:hypothetical protein